MEDSYFNIAFNEFYVHENAVYKKYAIPCFVLLNYYVGYVFDCM